MRLYDCLFAMVSPGCQRRLSFGRQCNRKLNVLGEFFVLKSTKRVVWCKAWSLEFWALSTDEMIFGFVFGWRMCTFEAVYLGLVSALGRGEAVSIGDLARGVNTFSGVTVFWLAISPPTSSAS